VIPRAAILALFVWGGAVRAQTPVVRFGDAGPGPGPELLARELAQPNIILAPSTQPALLRRDSTYARTVIALGRNVIVEGRVQGDVVAVAGDVFVHPGASIAGRVIAFGGGVYPSTLATHGEIITYRDFTYDILREQGAYVLTYREFLVQPWKTVDLPNLYGLALPTYDRTNGLSLGLGPDLSPRRTLLVQPRVVYRSQLGRFDPSLALYDSLNRRTSLKFSVGRGTFANETWIWSDLVNSAEYFLVGHDSRNWYRSTRGELTASRKWESPATTVGSYLGFRVEKATAVRPLFGAESEPWTFFGRHGIDDALRPNPEVPATTVGSFLAGTHFNWTGNDVTGRLNADLELGNADESCFGVGTCKTLHTISQLTLDGALRFPTFGTQSLQLESHIVASGTSTPLVRYAYVGGPGTLPTTEMLELGGNELFYLDARYNVPIDRIMLPVVGSPIVTFREVLAGAGVDRFPSIRQAVGGRVAIDLIYAEWLVDPDARRGRFSVGFSAAR
jgi:hypothetical protein